MPLRAANNPLFEAVLLAALPTIIAPSTQLALGSPSGTGLEQIYIHAKYALSQGAFPALLLSSGQQEGARNSTSTYAGTHSVFFTYYDRWDRQALSIDAERLDIAQDLERMRSNLEAFLKANRGITVNSIVYPLEMIWGQPSAYARAIESEFPGVPLGFRQVEVQFYISPYNV